MSHIDESFQEKHYRNMYFTLAGCEEDGFVKVPKIVIRAIMNWAGCCTDSNESEDYYKNPRAMFVALDLIYSLLDELQEDKVYAAKDSQGEAREWYIPKISIISHGAPFRALYISAVDFI